jgi:glycosyltransferase involved in cell wall biosynthesis
VRKRILFVCPVWDVNNTFVQNDYEILSRHFDIVRISYDPKDRLFFFRLLKHLPRYDLCFVWFSAEHAFLALLASRIVRRKIIVVGGGYDSVYMPEIGYGIKCTNKLWRLGYFTFRHADIVLAFSGHSKKSIGEISGAKRVRAIYMGFDHDKFIPGQKDSKMVITVCQVTGPNYKRKGLDTFIEVAKKLPELTFVIVGKDIDGTGEWVRKKGINNLRVTGGLTEEELKAYLSRAKVYTQLSAHEGFGCALAEAMLCECIPVVTDRGSLPEVAGPEAFYVKYNDVNAAAERVAEALAVDSGAKYRERVTKMFPWGKRENEICMIVNSLTSN